MKADIFRVLIKDVVEVSESERVFRMKISVNEEIRINWVLDLRGWIVDKNRIIMVNQSLRIGEYECYRGESDGYRGEVEKDQRIYMVEFLKCMGFYEVGDLYLRRLYG